MYRWQAEEVAAQNRYGGVMECLGQKTMVAPNGGFISATLLFLMTKSSRGH